MFDRNLDMVFRVKRKEKCLHIRKCNNIINEESFNRNRAWWGRDGTGFCDKALRKSGGGKGGLSDNGPIMSRS